MLNINMHQPPRNSCCHNRTLAQDASSCASSWTGSAVAFQRVQKQITLQQKNHAKIS